MPIPGFSKVLAGATKGAIKSTPFGGFASGAIGAITGASASQTKRRRRRRSLSQGQKNDILFLKDVAGAKAVENYLHMKT